MNPDGLFRRTLLGGGAAAGVALFLFSVGASLSSPWFLMIFPVALIQLRMAALPAGMLLALPLAALLRTWRPVLAPALGAGWVSIAGAALAAKLGAGVDDAFLLATVLVPAGVALGLGVIWPLRPVPPARPRAARSPARPSPRGSARSGRGSPPAGAR